MASSVQHVLGDSGLSDYKCGSESQQMDYLLVVRIRVGRKSYVAVSDTIQETPLE